MPTFHVDLVTDRGLQRVPFTFDDDRPLGSQLGHILEELRQRGVVLRGGPEDELSVLWNGREIDQSRTLSALGLTPHYPIELRMRRRAAAAAARSEPPATPFLPKAGYQGAVAGVTGAVLAWAIAALALADLPGFLAGYGALDVFVAGLLGALIGALVLGVRALRRAESPGIGLLVGALLGAFGGLVGAVLGGLVAGAIGFTGSRQSFVLARLIFWVLAASFIGAALGLVDVKRDARRVLDGLLFGLGAGLFGGLLMSLPGRTDLWQLLGFLVVGLGIGAGLSLPALQRALGVLELESEGRSGVGLLRHRGWEIGHRGVNRIGGLFEVVVQGGRCRLQPLGTSGAQLGGRPVTGATELLNQDVLTVGERRYRYRRFPERRL
ncbi:MAG: FHA domain-containing protein [Gemmatimonadales bacterium]